jgi:hypothetical protein
MQIMIQDGAAMFELKWATKPKYRQPRTSRVRIPVGRKWENGKIVRRKRRQIRRLR